MWLFHAPCRHSVLPATPALHHMPLLPLLTGFSASMPLLPGLSASTSQIPFTIHKAKLHKVVVIAAVFCNAATAITTSNSFPNS